MRWQTWGLVTVLGLSFVCYGCATESTKKLNDQNRQAGEKIKQDEQAKPETRQAGADVEQNSTVIGKDIGEPKEKVPYTPANSDKFRKEAAVPWWKRALNNAWTLVGTFVAGGGLANLLGRVAPAVAGPWGGIVTTLVTGVLKGRVSAEAATDPKDAIRKMLVSLESELSDEGYQGQVKSLAKKIENELDLDPQVTIR